MDHLLADNGYFMLRVDELGVSYKPTNLWEEIAYSCRGKPSNCISIPTL
jgi:hypothetical protein